jgi:hypothetical protein
MTQGVLGRSRLEVVIQGASPARESVESFIKSQEILHGAANSTAALQVAAPNSTPDIQTSVARIEQSQHVTLPALQPGAGTGPLIIQNDTSSVLTVYLSGATAQKQVVQPHARVPVTLPPGVYKLAGELADKSVLPFFAVRTYFGGETEQFYMVPR